MANDVVRQMMGRSFMNIPHVTLQIIVRKRIVRMFVMTGEDDITVPSANRRLVIPIARSRHLQLVIRHRERCRRNHQRARIVLRAIDQMIFRRFLLMVDQIRNVFRWRFFRRAEEIRAGERIRVLEPTEGERAQFDGFVFFRVDQRVGFVVVHRPLAPAADILHCVVPRVAHTTE